MRKKRWTKSEIIIDLTSLLDVIFIILLVVICNQQKLSEKLATEKADYETMVQEAQNEAYLYQDMLDSGNNYSHIISVYSYVEDSITTRHIVVKHNDEETVTYDLVGNDITDQYKLFSDMLEQIIEDNLDKPVILSLNEKDEAILYRDEKKILEIYNALKAYPNVYIK